MLGVRSSMFGASYSGDVYCRPSQFLEDFPQDLVEEWYVGNPEPWADEEPF